MFAIEAIQTMGWRKRQRERQHGMEKGCWQASFHSPYLFLCWYTKTTENSFFCCNLANLYCILCVAKLFLNLDYKVIFGLLHKYSQKRRREREKAKVSIWAMCSFFCLPLVHVLLWIQAQHTIFALAHCISMLAQSSAHTMRLWAIKNKVFWLSGSSILFAFRM